MVYHHMDMILRVSDEYKIFTNVNNSIVDPKKF